MTRRRRDEEIPLREELDALARYYHHLQREHQEAAPDSSVRRRIEGRLLKVRARIERVLEEWVPSEELRREWLEFLDHHVPEPSGPPPIRPLVYRGLSEVAGSVVEIRGPGDDLEVQVDGALVERVVAEKDFASTGPLVHFRLNGNEFQEVFGVSPEALGALADFLDDGGDPPWQYAQELLADGLVDVHFGVTPRGRRALAHPAA